MLLELAVLTKDLRFSERRQPSDPEGFNARTRNSAQLVACHFLQPLSYKPLLWAVSVKIQQARIDQDSQTHGTSAHIAAKILKTQRSAAPWAINGPFACELSDDLDLHLHYCEKSEEWWDQVHSPRKDKRLFRT